MRLLFCLMFLFSLSETFSINAEPLQDPILMVEANVRNLEDVTKISTEDTQSTTLIVYPENLGLVKTCHHVLLQKGINKLAFGGIPKKFVTNSLLIRSLDPQPLSFTTVIFRCDKLTFQNILEKSLGESVFIQSPILESSRKTEGVLLGVEQKKALVQKQGLIALVPSQDIFFKKIPLGLSFHPILHVHTISPCKQNPRLEITYLTEGLSWETTYTVEINPLKSQANITGWVTLQNTSGTHFPKASIQLASSQLSANRDSMVLKQPYLYPLHIPTSLYHGATKKVALFTANKIPAQKEFRILLPADVSKSYAGSTVTLDTQIWFSIQNTTKNHLGFSIPSGAIKIYEDPENNPTRYVGTSKVNHTNVGEAIQVPIDTCHLIDAKIQQIDFKKMGASVTEATFHVVLTNKNQQNVTVLLLQPLSPDSTLLHTTMDTLKIADNTIYWSLEIPKNQSLSLRYRIKTVRKSEMVDPQT